MKQKNTYSDDQLIEAVNDSISYAQVLKKLNLKPAGGNYETLKHNIERLNLDISHFKGQAWNKGIRYKNFSKSQPLETILIENSTYCSTYRLKLRLLAEHLKEPKCECCGNTEWLGKPIALELHHINGISSDLRLENLQILCPNCHAQTDNYRGKNIAKADQIETSSNIEILSEEEAKEREEKRRESRRIPKDQWKNTLLILEDKVCPICGKTFNPSNNNQKYCSLECYSEDRMNSSHRPSSIELIEKLKENKGNFTAVGKFYEVTDNAVRKWCRLYKISDKSKDYKS